MGDKTSMAAIVVFLITGALLVIALFAVINTLTFPRLRAPRHGANEPVFTPSVQTPRLSVLIPARDEAAVIGYTVRALLAQHYPCFEVIVLDDHSSDGTGAIAQAAAGGDSRLRVIEGADLLSGWLGKNWACHQLAQAAAESKFKPEYLIFADADVGWTPGALSALAAELRRTDADLLTVWPTQTTKTWGERLIVPLMALVVLGYLPIPLVHHTPWRVFAAANGQCMAFRRRAYDKVGGHIAVRGEIVEDIALSRRIKGRGLRLRMADGAGVIGCRMYRSWKEVRAGYAKNIIAGYGDSVIALLLASVFHWLVFLLPALWLLLGWLFSDVPFGAGSWPAWPLALTTIGLLIRALTAAATRQRVRDALLLPVSVLLMTRIAAQAIEWRWRHGGPQWKGRTITRAATPR